MPTPVKQDDGEQDAEDAIVIHGYTSNELICFDINVIRDLCT